VPTLRALLNPKGIGKAPEDLQPGYHARNYVVEKRELSVFGNFAVDFLYFV
jgi:hypothetical protein